MRFVVDAQLPPALARWLAAQGHHAEHVADLGMEAASDAAIWDWAQHHAATIVTKDEDFAIWRNTRPGTMPPVVWLRVGNTRRRELLRWFSPLLPKIIDALENGETLVEVC
jgi:predicted nuclease of predicted toxin-antitoxin system